MPRRTRKVGGILYKQCPQCLRYLPTDSAYYRPTKTGFMAQCRACQYDQKAVERQHRQTLKEGKNGI